MMTISSNVSSSTDGTSSYPEDHSTTSSSTSWKLIYYNPFFYNKPFPLPNNNLLSSKSVPTHQRSPFSAREMEREEIRRKKDTVIDAMRAKTEELKAALHHQRRARRKSEHFNKLLIKELNKERRGREMLERVCEELTEEISRDRASTEKMRKDMEEERRMLRMAEVLREARVQMKLAEAKILFEEKIMSSQLQKNRFVKQAVASERKEAAVSVSAATHEGGTGFVKWKPSRLVLGEKLMMTCNDDNKSCSKKKKKKTSNNTNSTVLFLTGRSVAAPAAREAIPRNPPLPENPHIKRGIKGFVEFPRVMRAVESKMSRHKIECHKSQIKILLKPTQ